MKNVLPKLDPVSWGGDFTLDLDYYLGHDYLDIAEACTELPAVIEWVNERLQRVTEDRLRIKSKIKRMEAKAYFRLKDGGYEADGYAGKATNEALERAISLNPEVQKEEDEFAVLSGWHVRLVNLITSLQSKLDLTRSVESTRRRLVEDSQTKGNKQNYDE